MDRAMSGDDDLPKVDLKAVCETYAQVFRAPSYYTVREERTELRKDPAYWWEGPSTWRSAFALERMWVPVLRDANEGEGEWRARLPHDLAEVDIGERTFVVPVYLPDPERARWRRRKWWGRGPVRPWMTMWGECASRPSKCRCSNDVLDRSMCTPF